MSTRPGTPIKWPRLKPDEGKPDAGMTQRSRTVPPEERLTVAGYNKHCPTCWRFVRRGGGCPGVQSASAMEPICHEAANGQQATGNRHQPQATSHQPPAARRVVGG